MRNPPAHGPAPLVVPKPDGSIRLCIDFQRPNQISQFKSYPLPRANNLVEQLGKAWFISTLDLTKGYWQVALAPMPSPRWPSALPMATGKTGFFLLACMGHQLHSSSSWTSSSTPPILSVAYVDDVVNHSSTCNLHLQEVLTSHTVLRNPDFGLHFTFKTDALGMGLEQSSPRRLKGRSSQSCSSPENFPHIENYTAVKQEALAIKWAIKELRYYLARVP